MAGAFVVGATPVGGANGGTTAGVDTTGANLITLAVTRYGGGGTPTVSDSKSNTWTARTEYGSSLQPSLRLYDCYAPTVGSGHTFTVSGSGIYASVGALAFSGADTSPYDQIAGADSASGTTLQPGSITPSGNGYIVVSAFGCVDSVVPNVSINSGFSTPIYLAFSGGNNYRTELSYLIHTSGAINPTWTGDQTMATMVATQVSYKVSAGGGDSQQAESIAFTDGQASQVVFENTRAESIAFTDAQTGAAVTANTRGESIAFTDSQTSAAVFGAAQAESIAFSDGVTGDTGIYGYVNESVAFADSSTTQLAAYALRPESIAFADSQISQAVFNNTRGESVAFTDSSVGTGGGGTTYDIMNPYIVVYMWKRTA